MEPVNSRKPLDGRKIMQIVCEDCSISVVRSVYFCCRIAADLGARVTCIGPARQDLDAASHAFLMAGKRVRTGSIVDLETEIGAADAVVACCEPDDLAKGPAVIRIGLLPEGAEPQRANGFTLMAASGMLDIVGDDKRQPLKLAGSQLDYAAGLSAYTAMAGLLAGGRGGSAYVSLLDVGIWLNWKSLVVAHGGGVPPSRKGRNSEWQVLRCRDGWIAMVYREGDWAALKRLVDDPRLDEPELDIRANRRRRGAFIADIVEQKFLTMSRADIVDFAKRNRVPLGPVLTLEEIVESPQYTQRAFFHSVETADGPLTMPRVPVRWGDRVFPPGPVPEQIGAEP
ncbi:L-carnitine dehydratase/bile acid-inducible protein F [Rhizobium sp. CF080]|nr:L-carnitine dehydratase/bile acid-inducible protein F [Rhizobium sp. CF080]